MEIFVVVERHFETGIAQEEDEITEFPSVREKNFALLYAERSP